jgi:hypothetical protein
MFILKWLYENVFGNLVASAITSTLVVIRSEIRHNRLIERIKSNDGSDSSGTGSP